MRRTIGVAAALAGCGWFALATSVAAGAEAVPVSSASRVIPGAALFTKVTVRRIRIDLASSELESLRQQSRGEVRATVRDGERTYREVALHVKGSKGSFRGLDDKPALTLTFDGFTPGQRFDGLRKIHLNNSVEDPGYLNECLGGELFRAAGVPAPRVAWALVELNGRKLGLYVLKEGFTEDFLGLYFRGTDGNLYDTGAGHDVTEPMKRSSGAGPEDRADLQVLAVAALEPDRAERWRKLQEVLDVDRFISFLAMEIMVGHRDGYSLAKNNFRIYHDADSGKILFFPHGMDQLFGRPDAPLQPHLAGVVAQAVMDTPEGHRRYRERVSELLTNVFQAAVLTNHVSSIVRQIQPSLNGAAGRELEQQAVLLQQRIVQRAVSLAKQLAEPQLKPLLFENGVAKLAGWRKVDEPAGSAMEQGKSPDGRPALHIRAGPVTAATWRTKVLLEPGLYRLAGLVSTAGVAPLKFGKNNGAILRVAGGASARTEALNGDSGWKKLEVEFAVAVSGEEVEVVCELRASRGEVWFDAESMRLARVSR